MVPIISDVLISILGSGAFEIVKRILKTALGIVDDNLSQKIYSATETASARFFSKYGDRFGRPHESFLARESTWNAIFSSLFYSAVPLKTTEILHSLPIDIASPSEAAIADFLMLLKEEMSKDWFLDKILTEKEQAALTIEQQKKMLEILSTLTAAPEASKGARDVAIPFYGEGGKLLAHGQVYTINHPNGGMLHGMVSGRTIYCEYVFADGLTAYYEVGVDGDCKLVKLPRPLEEYALQIPVELILNDSSRINTDGYRERSIRLKWGGNVVAIYTESDQLTHVDLKTRFSVDHQKRLIMILGPNSEAL